STYTSRVMIADFAQAAVKFPNSFARIQQYASKAPDVCVNLGPQRRTITNGNTALAVTPRRSGAFEWARSLGILGLKATQKKVPEEVFSLCDQDLELFLGRLWAGDGFISDTGTNNTPFYATSSEQLAYDVQAL